MQEYCQNGVYRSPEIVTVNNYHSCENGWFPSHPECPNHRVGVPFNSAFSHPNEEGQVSCANCFLHSTIIQSMKLSSCQHLHASHDCKNCYSSDNNNTKQRYQTQGSSPPLFSCSPQPNSAVSPPLNHQIIYPTNSVPLVQHKPALISLNPNSSSLISKQQKYAYDQLEMPAQHLPPTAPGTPKINDLQNESSYLTEHNLHQSTVPEKQDVTSSHNKSGVSATTCFKNGTKISKSSQYGRNIKHENNRKRGANDQCEVCGDRASGYHYNALTCEGCKGFFRRSINRKEPLFRCKYGGDCEMDTYTRRKCPECRLKKCKAVGMLEECLLTEIQCLSKRRNRNIKRRKNSNNSKTSVGRSSTTQIETSYGTSNFQQNRVDQKSERLTAEEEKLIYFITTAFSEYANNQELVKGWESYLKKSKSSCPPNLCELATSHVKVLVEFTKKLPGFDRMSAEDQIGLLKGCVVEIMLLRNCHSYNQKKGDIDMSVVARDTGMHEANFRCLLDFFNKVDKLDLDNTEYGLLSSIILFDCDHANTTDKIRIDKYRDMYVSAMKSYSERRKPKRIQAVAKILNLITELRTLNSTHARMVSNFRKTGELSPLLCEIWDL